MKKIAIISMFLMLGFATLAQATAITTYNSVEAFLAATTNMTLNTENFVDYTLIPGLTITEVGNAGTIDHGMYNNVVKNNSSYQVFNYAPGMNAFGGWFETAIGGEGSSINVYINDNNTYALNIPSTSIGGFYGFSADSTFYGVRFEDGLGAGRTQETYYSIDMTTATATPIPAAAWLLGSGILGLVGLKRRMNK